MTTRISNEEKIKTNECTSFQLHKSQQSTFNGLRHKILDYAEYRLKYLLCRCINTKRRSFLQDLIKRYCNGDVAIAWHFGEPVFVTIIKEN